ncbi:MAG: DUF2795 domain-containing protein [Armatimonadetes bacterium]|nr:MAG: DUF2795 domain-containing protein [Armatimonadota bacterium]
MNPAMVQQYLEGADYPISKDQLVEYVQSKGAPEQAVDMLRKLPGENFSSPSEVSGALGQMGQQQGEKE